MIYPLDADPTYLNNIKQQTHYKKSSSNVKQVNYKANQYAAGQHLHLSIRKTGIP